MRMARLQATNCELMWIDVEESNKSSSSSQKPYRPNPTFFLLMRHGTWEGKQTPHTFTRRHHFQFNSVKLLRGGHVIRGQPMPLLRTYSVYISLQSISKFVSFSLFRFILSGSDASNVHRAPLTNHYDCMYHLTIWEYEITSLGKYCASHMQWHQVGLKLIIIVEKFFYFTKYYLFYLILNFRSSSSSREIL